MRKLLIVALLPLAACQSNWEKGEAAQPSGTGGSRSFAATGFTSVDLRGPDDVDVRTGANFAVTAEGDSAVLDKLDIRVDGDTLRVGRKDSHDWSMRSERGVKIHVVMPKLGGASVAGSGNLTADRGEGAFHASIAGSGNLSIGELRATDADLSIAGSGDIQVAGSATKLSASIAGSGDIDAAGFSASAADVSIAGSGSIRSTVKGEATVSIIGSGDAELTGGAKCHVSKIGSGEARCN
ncbi:MAG: DUF2807 domain-containing protein [Sphingomonas sp.]|uniref:head GIN domain-containing protein n=1 Tax=Sphingomonas sp. TaxID=28214 RepID=UPI001B0406D1|nr:head GIN domain-containing protein [Sphingomonas sp.]MBO9621742.1 DUF2807 domain-containing protein [Sphingomonas sp.]